MNLSLIVYHYWCKFIFKIHILGIILMKVLPHSKFANAPQSSYCIENLEVFTFASLFGMKKIFFCGLFTGSIQGLPRYHHISMKNVWQKCYIPITLSPHTSYNLHIVHRIQNLQKYFHIFWEVRLPQTCLSQKAQEMESFCLSPF